MWQNQATRRKLSVLSLLTAGWTATLGIVLFPLASLAEETSALDALGAYWKAHAPWCPFHSPSDYDANKFVLKEFASKNEDGMGSNTPPCNDGDSIMFNALLCLAGVKVEPGEYQPTAGEEKAIREVGCDVVKHSQTLTEGSPDYGRWWRSPRRNYLASLDQQPEGRSETTFSNDHALGVMAYIAQTKDARAFQAWTDWIRDKGGTCSSLSCIPGLPRFCLDDRCGFKIVDCPMLDVLAKYLRQENRACASGSVKAIQATASDVARSVLIVFPKLNDIINRYGTGSQGNHSVERIAIINSIINDQGYPLHSVAASIYLLRKFGLANHVESQIAADILYARAGDNAFFDFIANGPTTGVKAKIVSTCPLPSNDIPHPKFQWIWERQDISETAKKTMYWDCVFMANAFIKNDYPPSTAVPGMTELAIQIARLRDAIR
jgi:hypothetical protein